MPASPSDDLQQLTNLPPFCCLGAAHEDRILQLHSPLLEGRTNPAASHAAPGGVAAQLALRLAQLGADVELVCLRPPPAAQAALDDAGVAVRPIGNEPCAAHYTAVLDEQGELLAGYAATEQYDRIGPEQIPAQWFDQARTGRKGVAVIDANFSSEAVRLAAAEACDAGWNVMACGTSPAKAGRIIGARWNALSLNEEECSAFADREHSLDEFRKAQADAQRWIAVTCGADGAALQAAGREHRCAPPQVELANANGAGDAFAAVLFAAHACGIEAEQALRMACSAGAAAASGLWPASARPGLSQLAAAMQSMGAAEPARMLH